MTSNYIKLLQKVDNKKVDCDVYVISLRGKMNGTWHCYRFQALHRTCTLDVYRFLMSFDGDILTLDIPDAPRCFMIVQHAFLHRLEPPRLWPHTWDFATEPYHCWLNMVKPCCSIHVKIRWNYQLDICTFVTFMPLSLDMEYLPRNHVFVLGLFIYFVGCVGEIIFVILGEGMAWASKYSPVGLVCFQRSSTRHNPQLGYSFQDPNVIGVFSMVHHGNGQSPIIDDFPMKTSIYIWGFPPAMFDYWIDLQGGAPKIANLVYNSNNYGFCWWYIYSFHGDHKPTYNYRGILYPLVI